MKNNIWNKCKGQNNITNLEGIVFRLQSQENISLRKLVDSIEEQSILENLIESTKVHQLQGNLHKLLYAPFREPPLKNGSRFGKRSESSIWYGSFKLPTAMAEKAYYEFCFLNASVADFGLIEKILTSFSAFIKTNKAIKFDINPFYKYKKVISSPVSYEESQLLGSQMREHKIDAFSFISARDPNENINIGLLNPKPLKQKIPDRSSLQIWQCVSSKNIVEFVKISSVENESFNFVLNDFTVNGNLPSPGN